MAVFYYKIGRELIKQNRYMKSICSNPVRRSASFNILKFIRNRRTFFICLITFLCYAIGNIPVTVYFILNIAEEHNLLMKIIWFVYLAKVLRVSGSYSVNPLIYGRLHGQKIALILETLPQEETETMGRLLDSSCSKLNKQDIFIDCHFCQLIGRRLFFQDETCISLIKFTVYDSEK
jgi:hypothetical protein